MVKDKKSLRKIFKKVPGGKLKIHYEKRKPARAKCASCGKPLAGVPKERPYKMKKLPKTKKRPQRIYGGILCHSCTKSKIIEKIRKEENV